MQYIVNYSTGLFSTEALERTIGQKDKANTIAVFADVKGHSTEEYAGEDEDSYRFMSDVEKYFDIKIIRIVEGRDIWQVMFDERAITLPVGKTKVAPCSIKLKREPIDAWVAAHYSPHECVRVAGLGWSELKRIKDFAATIAPYQAWFPMNEAPYMDNCHIANKWRARGIEPPRMYDEGFEHGNCGRFCVKAGQAHFARLYFTDRQRYLYHAAKEKHFNETINVKASILRDRRGGETKPMLLYEFAERLDRGEEYDKDDVGGCGCFSQTPQLRMDDLLLEASIQ